MRILAFVFVLPLVAVVASANTRLIQPRVINIEVQGNKSFIPSAPTASVGDRGRWISLGRSDSIVPVDDATAEPCDAASALAVDYEGTDEFIGPPRLGVPGLFVRLGDDGGPEIINWPGTCSGGPLPTPFDTCTPDGNANCPTEACCDTDPSPMIAGSLAYCDDQNGAPEFLLASMWDFDELMGQLFIIDWADIETDDGVYDWTRLDHELDIAADHGKFITIAVKTGLGASPGTGASPWLFDDLGAPGSADDVTPVILKGTNNDNVNDTTASSCGQDWATGSYTDPAYVAQLDELIMAIGAHVKTNGAWTQAVAATLLIGIHIGTDEFQAQTICLDNFHNACDEGGTFGTFAGSCGSAGNGHSVSGADGVLDSYSHDDCVCNAGALAMAVNGGWAVDTLLNFVQAQTETWQEAFWPHLVVRFGLKQGSLPGAPNTAGAVPNFGNDTMLDQTGARICPTCVTTDDNLLVQSTTQVDAIIGRGLNVFGDTFWTMHHGLDPLPLEFPGDPAAQNCTFGALPDLLATPPVIPFPIPLVGPVGTQDRCPNKWANNTTLTPPHPHMTGFQTNNPGSGEIRTPALVESSMLNLERNTNAVYWEGYAGPFWMNHELNDSTGDMNPLRESACPGSGFDPDMCYSKSAVDHATELINRRDIPNVFENASGKAFPTAWEHTFTAPGTHRYYVPSGCEDDTTPFGTITIN